MKCKYCGKRTKYFENINEFWCIDCNKSFMISEVDGIILEI